MPRGRQPTTGSSYKIKTKTKTKRKSIRSRNKTINRQSKED